jgi:hypothetical protein
MRRTGRRSRSIEVRIVTFPLLDQIEKAIEARDRGMESVLSHTPEEFKAQLIKRVENFPSGYRFTMDRIVDDLGGRPRGVHQNAIGALTFSMAKRNLIKRTGVMLKAARTSLHRTDMPEWIRL